MCVCVFGVSGACFCLPCAPRWLRCPGAGPGRAAPGRERGGSRQMERKATNRDGHRAGGRGTAELPGPLIHKTHKSSGVNNNRKKRCLSASHEAKTLGSPRARTVSLAMFGRQLRRVTVEIRAPSPRCCICFTRLRGKVCSHHHPAN